MVKISFDNFRPPAVRCCIDRLLSFHLRHIPWATAELTIGTLCHGLCLQHEYPTPPLLLVQAYRLLQ